MGRSISAPAKISILSESHSSGESSPSTYVMSHSPAHDSKAVTHGSMIGTREENISDWAKRDEVAAIKKQHPDVDFKGVVIEPTVNFVFDLQEHVDEDNQKRYSKLMVDLMDPDTSVEEGKKILLEARGCLKDYPKILDQFDGIFMQGDLTTTVERLRSVTEMKGKAEKMVAEEAEAEAEASRR